MSRLSSLAIGLVIIAVAACGTATPASPVSDGRIKVVTTTTILADFVTQVGGDRVSVESLVPKGGEVHTFDPSPSDVRRISEADVVFLNGLGLDDWLAALVADAGSKAPVIALGENLAGVQYISGGEGGSAGVNPHLWLNPAYAAKYTAKITDALVTASPANEAALRAGGAAYITALEALNTELATRMASIPAANRTVVSFHDAFPYFAVAFGLTVDGTIVDAPGQDPSAAQIAALVTVIRTKGIRAIFAEAQFSEDLARTIADETGATVVSNLYTDSTGDGSQGTYEGLMRWNIERVAAALTRP